MPMQCKECRHTVDLNFTNYETLAKHQVCQRCNFWRERLEANPPNSVRILSEHYSIAEDRVGLPKHLKGFGGAEVRIHYKDGTTRVTDNLWHQGTIPVQFRERFADNADRLEWLSPLNRYPIPFPPVDPLKEKEIPF